MSKTPGKSKAGTRLLSLDILRAVALILMIQVHFVQNLSPRVVCTGWLYDLAVWLGYLPAPLFTFLVGLSLYLWLAREEAAGGERSRTVISRGIKRGVALFVTGLVFAVVIWLPKELFDWDILTLIGTAMVVILLLRKLSLPVLGLICTGLLLIAPPLRDALNYPSYWREGEYFYSFTVKEVVAGFFGNGYFPVFPWLLFPISGFMCGKMFYGAGGEKKRGMMGYTGAFFLVLAGILFALRGRTGMEGISFYPASTVYVLGILGLIMVAAVILGRMFDRRQGGKDGIGAGVCRRFSRYALALYLIHHAVHVWPMYVASAIKGSGDIEQYYGKAVSTPMALILAWVFMICADQIIKWREEKKY